MNNIHTLDSLKNNNSISNSNTITLTPDSVNDGSQLLPVLKLRASNNEINEVQSSLDRLIEDHRRYMEENGTSSISESFPNLYPPAIEDEITVTSLFDIIKNIYNRFINSGVDIDENNINTLSNLIRNDPSSGNLNEDIKEVLNAVVTDLNNSINTNNLKPLGQFGDITLNELILKGQNLDFSFLINNQELIVYPLKLIPIGLVYGTIIRLFVKHCDDYTSIQKETDILKRIHLLRVRRVNIATTLALTAPIATILLIKFGQLNIFDGIKIGINKDNIVNNSNELLNYIGIFTTLQKKKNQNPKLFKLILLLFIIICVVIYKYNIFIYINNINIYILYYIWVLILIFSIVYNSIGYFILINKNEIDIDLNKIRIKFIRKNIESFIAIRNSKIDTENMKKYFITQLYLSLFVIILSGFLILI